jgi:hypothetical protein
LWGNGGIQEIQHVLELVISVSFFYPEDGDSRLLLKLYMYLLNYKVYTTHKTALFFFSAKRISNHW